VRRVRIFGDNGQRRPIGLRQNRRVVNETYDAESEMIPIRWGDGVETRPRRSKTPRDRDYNPAVWPHVVHFTIQDRSLA